jgi:hypothetical protein
MGKMTLQYYCSDLLEVKMRISRFETKIFVFVFSQKFFLLFAQKSLRKVEKIFGFAKVLAKIFVFAKVLAKIFHAECGS